MTYKQYKPEELKKLQKLSVSILAELDRVCRLLDIPYVAYGGTAIGAVRHQGFIPWDDDVDIAFLRADYERFIEQAPAVLQDHFAIENYHTDPHFPACNSNLVLKDTLCVPEEFDACPFQYKLGIGLYPLDVVSDDKKLFERQRKKTWLFARLAFLRATPRPHLTLTGGLRFCVLFACFIAHWGMKIVHVSPRWIHEQWERAAQAANDEDTGLYCDFADRNPLDWSLTRDELFPLVEMPFDTITLNLPHAYDTLLTRGYGDYMALPPESDRKNHYPSKLDFGPYETALDHE